MIKIVPRGRFRDVVRHGTRSGVDGKRVGEASQSASEKCRSRGEPRPMIRAWVRERTGGGMSSG